MKCQVLHESKGRIRIHFCISKLSLRQADLAEYYLKSICGVEDVKVFDRTADAVIFYCCSRSDLISALARFSFENAEKKGLVPDRTSRQLNRDFEDKLVFSVLRRFASKLFLPSFVRSAIAIFRSVKYIKAGVKSLLNGKLSVSVLDATAVAVSLIRRDFGTAGSVMFMLGLGEMLEDWTHKKSVSDLAGAMALNVDKAWVKAEEGEILMSLSDISAGDKVIVRTGNMIPLDGKVCDGEAMVNQASMTGESLPVRKVNGSYAYAGTVVEEGECTILVEKTAGGGRYDRIVKMIEQSEKLKSTAEDKASRLADRLVPLTLGGTALTYLFTRNVTKMLSVLMVDFSCALKLSMPIAVLSAMREGNKHNISVKGGRFLEAVANADTVVFDKTGTLTYAKPTVAEIVTFSGRNEDDMLRLAACLEEHYPHSLANAVVEEAKKRGLNHEEYHSKVEYVVAHGISSTVEDKKVVIGSYHFVFEDEGCTIPPDEKDKFSSLSEEYSHLYLAVSGVLRAVICIYDPLRAEARDIIDSLHDLGISKVVMMTGDNRKTAAAVAKTVGVDEFYAEVLPEDKAEFIRNERKNGRCVIMIGDGVNDTPALSEADAGIAINSGAAIAREVADITVSSENLSQLVVLRKLSTELMSRVDRNYRFIVGFNFLLILLGVTGVIQPTFSALLHNASTLGISLKSMTNLLPAKSEEDETFEQQSGLEAATAG